MSDLLPQPVEFGVLLPSVGVYGGVRRFVEIGNELVRRGHRYVLYHPTGEPPDWLPFAGETRAIADMTGASHDVLICNDPPLLPVFDAAPAALKLFYFALEGIPGERRIARHPEWVAVANSTGMANRLRRLHGVRAEQAIGGIDLATFKRPEVTRKDGGTVRVMAFGRLSRSRKGIPIAVRAAESLARALRRGSNREVTMVLFDHVGHGNERDPRSEIKSALPVEFHLNLTQQELATLYGGCDFFVSAEKRAGWSNTVAEAMACGTTVVCTRSGTRDLALHRETAWVTPWRHSLAIAHGLKTLSRQPAVAGRLRDAAARRVRDFAWPVVVDQLEGIVRRQLVAGARDHSL